MNEGIYYLRLNGNVEGPYTLGQIYDLWAARKINSQTPFARFEEMDKWQPLSELTLKISAPRAAAAAKTPAALAESPGQPVLPSARSRPIPQFQPEEIPSAPLLHRDDLPSKRTRPSTDPLDAVKKLVVRPKFFSGCSFVIGAVLIIYFAWLSPVNMNPSSAQHTAAVIQQTGVLAGIGFFLLGGLLAIAQKLSDLTSATQARQQPDSKTGTSRTP